jgi:hypothetical protein
MRQPDTNLRRRPALTHARAASIAACVSVALALAMPGRTQPSEHQVAALVEALRLAAPKTGVEDDGLYSDWQIKPENVTRWSKRCLDRELTPEGFEENPIEARKTVTCVISGVLPEQYAAAGGNETLAVRRVAAWWMTGDVEQYDSGPAASYVDKVLGFYRDQRQR